MSGPGTFATILLILAAPAFGSFAGLLATRLPAGEPVLMGRSRCDGCGRTLGPVELVPIFGWLLVRGRCKSCGEAVRPDYPAIELAALGLAVWALAIETGPGAAWLTAALGWTLLTLAVIDMRHFLLPDALTLPLAAAGLIVAAARGYAVDGIIGAAAGYAALALIAWLYHRRTGREGLGLGDAKLFAAAGAWAGWQGLPGVLLLASLAGLMWAIATGGLRAKRKIAFGPFLAAGFWLTWLYGPLGL